MSYLKRTGKKQYQAKYDVPPPTGRKRKLETITLKNMTQPEAEAEVARLKAAAWKLGPVENPNMTMNQLFDLYIESRKRIELGGSTLNGYENILRPYLRPAFGHLKAKEFNKYHLSDAVQEWKKRRTRRGTPPKPKTLTHVVNLLQETLKWACLEELLMRNGAAGFDRRELGKVIAPEPVVLEMDELKLILATANNPTPLAKKRGTVTAQSWFPTAVLFTMCTACRRGEVPALLWTSVNLKTGELKVERAFWEAGGNGGTKLPKDDEIRSVMLPGMLVEALRAHRIVQQGEKAALGSGYRDHGLVFAQPNGEPVNLDSFGVAFIRTVKRAETQRGSLKSLRSTHLSLLAEAGVAIEVLGKRAGHEEGSPTTAKFYVGVPKRRDVAAAETWEKLMTE
jgi:integrase